MIDIAVLFCRSERPGAELRGRREQRLGAAGAGAVPRDGEAGLSGPRLGAPGPWVTPGRTHSRKHKPTHTPPRGARARTHRARTASETGGDKNN